MGAVFDAGPTFSLATASRFRNLALEVKTLLFGCDESAVFDATQLKAETDPNTGVITRYMLDPDRNAATDSLTFSNPDFNFRSLRGNAVLRWEYRPGSTLFFVWQQERSGSAGYGDFSFDRDASAVFRQHPDNIFVIKASYWFGR